MEFGSTQQPQGSPDITDAARMEASSRMHTVLPAHDTVVPDDLSDEQIVTQHMVQPAVANAANDTEYIQDGKDAEFPAQKAYHLALTISISISLILAALLIYVFLVFV